MSLINRLIHMCIVAVEMSLVKPSPFYIHNCCLSVDKAMLAVINQITDSIKTNQSTCKATILS